MRIPFRLVDVFTERPLAGNQLCVVPDPVETSTETMFAITREIGFSETTFVSEAGGDRYAMRIFTPGGELPFAGHPSLGTGFVLISEGRVTSPATQVVTAGEFRVEADPATGFARMRQGAPEFGSEVDESQAPAVAASVGLAVSDLHPTLRAQTVSTGLGHLMVPAADPEAVARARPDVPAIAKVLDTVGGAGLYLFAAEGPVAKARMFDATMGIGADPATGSAAGPLGAYLAEHGVMGDGRLEISQGVELGRPSTLLVDVARHDGAWSIHVGGGVAIVGEGTFDIPG
jgi:trans-2,3-dihydro-3-hydroxyanthranilate isomerase